MNEDKIGSTENSIVDYHSVSSRAYWGKVHMVIGHAKPDTGKAQFLHEGKKDASSDEKKFSWITLFGRRGERAKKVA